jgi:hypothetical protein
VRGDFDDAADRCEHFMVATGTQELNHFVLTLERSDLMQFCHVTQRHNSTSPFFKD